MTNPYSGQAPVGSASDTLLGVCSGIAEATGMPALIVRIAFVVAILGVSIEWAVGAYLVLALALAIARLAGPRPGSVGHGR